jgi:hypothetical protein
MSLRARWSGAAEGGATITSLIGFSQKWKRSKMGHGTGRELRACRRDHNRVLMNIRAGLKSK